MTHPDATAGRVGVLIANLGSPTEPTAAGVRRFLAEFLWDPRVVDLPRPLWWLILNGVILRIRPRKVARATARVARITPAGPLPSRTGDALR